MAVDMTSHDHSQAYQVQLISSKRYCVHLGDHHLRQHEHDRFSRSENETDLPLSMLTLVKG